MAKSIMENPILHQNDSQLVFDYDRDTTLLSKIPFLGIKPPAMELMIYCRKESLELESLPNYQFATHTMRNDNIKEYVNSKLNVKAIDYAMENNLEIEIHGIQPSHFLKIYESMGYSRIKAYEFTHSRKKNLNFARPEYYTAFNEKEKKNILILLVQPGRDYLKHFASMLNFKLNTELYHNKLKVFAYPDAESTIHLWSGLNEKIIKMNDRVIIGYVDEMELRLFSDDNLIDSFENDFYKCKRFLLPDGSMVNLVGCKNSFWGNISAKLVLKMCELGAKEIIYIGKLGTLEKSNAVYKKIYSPSTYVYMNQNKVLAKIDNNELINPFLGISYKGKNLDSGSHLSVSTILEENIEQREIAKEFMVNSIDNEISSIAYAIKCFNVNQSRNVHFGCLHLASDFLHGKTDTFFNTENLVKKRNIRTDAKKNLMLDKIAEVLKFYLFEDENVKLNMAITNHIHGRGKSRIHKKSSLKKTEDFFLDYQD